MVYHYVRYLFSTILSFCTSLEDGWSGGPVQPWNETRHGRKSHLDFRTVVKYGLVVTGCPFPVK